MINDLRDWLDIVEKKGQLRRVNGVNWDLELGCFATLNARSKSRPALLFDEITGYPRGYRVLTGSLLNPLLEAFTFNLGEVSSTEELRSVLRERIPAWESTLKNFPPKVVHSGPILENIQSGRDVDLLKFPVPKWHDLDGGRYIGTGDSVITRDPDTGQVNLGTYRVMVHDRNTVGHYISPGKHGAQHRQKYHSRGESSPVAVCVGHHPLMFGLSCLTVTGGSEYNYMGAIRGEPVEVIEEEITGLPIPAHSEIVIVGWCPPGITRDEGPFGEWTGYYASKKHPAPIIQVERVYHRDNPILLGSPNAISPSDDSYHFVLFQSALIENDLAKVGIPGVRGVWLSEVGYQQLIAVSIKQAYAGHARQVGTLVSQLGRGAHMNRYVIVVDEDIDPTNIQEVLWALCTRSDPEKDIDIIRRTRSSPLDPMIRKPAQAFFNSRAIIDACKPYEWIDEFPEALKLNPELVERVKASKLLDL